ncbi:pilus assembly protein [Methylobacterium sp. C25]|uniref:TadE/TadG family type IV pilus assembly protein n=1 Tax=Methylobacterium sp. C25 TaxID=2721622 RepID=UPI0022790E3A|nr:TadE/TadG family type IV pilus assembly protein [Methylobacterium sp. C25]MCE4222515.1 pilus assembly protein [Methylobacterium sp. C25]
MRALLALSLIDVIGRLRRHEGGNVAAIFAVTSVPMVMMAGVTIDYGANSAVKQQLQNAVDATTLSLAKLPLTLSQSDLESRAITQIAAAMAKSQIAGLKIDAQRSDGNYTVTATGTTPTTLTRLAGFSSLPLKVIGTTKRGSGNLEIAMVLDNTGSMDGAKITNLKAAATKMVGDLFDQVDPAKPNSLKIAVVPFSQTVNVGASNVTAGWLDTKGLASYHSQIFNAKGNRLALFATLGQPWAGCVEGRIMPYDVQDTAASQTAPDTLFVPYFAPDESDNDGDAINNYLQDYATSAENKIANNNGVKDRDRQGLLAKYALPVWKTATSNLQAPNYAKGPNYQCSMQPITPLTTTKSTITTAIANMNATGETNIPIGLAWGWHNLSPNGPMVKGAPYSDQNTRKFIILMTDGDNTNFRYSSDNGSKYSGISYIWTKRIGNLNEYSSDAARTKAMDARMSILCDNIKSAGVQIFTIRVEVKSGTSTLLQSCASNPGMFFDVADSANLTAAFQQIGAQISELRLSR